MKSSWFIDNDCDYDGTPLDTNPCEGCEHDTHKDCEGQCAGPMTNREWLMSLPDEEFYAEFVKLYDICWNGYCDEFDEALLSEWFKAEYVVPSC